MLSKCKSCVARTMKMLNNEDKYDLCALYQWPCDMMTKCDYYIVNADVQPVDEITKIIQARLNGVQKVKIDAMLSGDSTTAYKMVGAETVCIAILQDLEAIKG